MKYKVGDKVRVKRTLSAASSYGGVLVNTDMAKRGGEIVTITKIYDDGYNISGDYWFWSDEMLEPAYADGGYVPYHKIPTPEKPVSIEEQLGLPKGVSIHDLDIASLYRPMNIDVQPLELVCNEEKAKEIAERLNKELAGRFNAFPNDGILAKNGGKNSMKFTFYVTEGTRVDKSCNGTIPTMTTTITNGLDEVSVTCDKADYNERQGVLEGIAQLYCKGRFDKEYEAAVKINKRSDKANRTCIYCGKIFDTAEERAEHEKWHVERKKARRERYLLRKRAKEIAFEEAAQKMAKEMVEK